MPTKPKGSRRPAASLGPAVCRWMEANLVHGEGDYHGQPFRLRPYQRAIIDQCYALTAEGRRRYDRVVIGMGKGNGKTELAAALALAELCGPVTPAGLRVSPDIPTAAASFDQADLVFGACRTMIRQGRLAEHCEVFDKEIQLTGRPGRLYRVPAVAGTNDGARPTFFVGDELHEWEGNKGRVYSVLQNGRAKRQDGWQLGISTAGWDPASLLGTLYQHGKRVASGEDVDPGFLFIWYEAGEHWDLEKPAELEAAIREANPAAGDYLPLENLIRQYHTIPEPEFRRFHLNQWVAAPTQWLPPETVHRARQPFRVVPDGAPVVLGFDGSYRRDSTALVAATVEEVPHLFPVAAWERPEHAGDDWAVPREEVLDAILEAHARWHVQRFAFDDTFGGMYAMDLEGLRDKGVELVSWATRARDRMGPAATRFHGALQDGRLTHDGDERLVRHMGNAVAKGSRWGMLPTKVSPDSTRHIDLLVAAIIAYDMATRAAPEPVAWLLDVVPRARPS